MIRALVLIVVLSGAVRATAQTDSGELFVRANQAYRQNAYPTAAAGYRAVLAQLPDSGPLWFNLGNCFFKMERIGKALACYRTALRYTPRDEDLRANIASARQQQRDVLECPGAGAYLREVCFWYDALSERELAVVAIGLSLLAAGAFLLGIVLRRPQACVWAWALLLCMLLTGASWGVKHYVRLCRPGGVVVVDELAVRSAPGLRTTVPFRMHAGADVTRLEQDGDWIEIGLCDGKRGWVPAARICLIGALPDL